MSPLKIILANKDKQFLINTFHFNRQKIDFDKTETQDEVKALLLSAHDYLGNQIFYNMKVLGSGGFGIVFQGSCIFYPNEEVAIKFQIENNPDENITLEIMNELNNQAFDILTLHFYDNFPLKSNDQTSFNIIIEEKADEDLEKIIKNKNRNKIRFTFVEKKKIFEDLMTCLYFLHMRKIAHFDIKPSNVLFYKKYNQYILRDFGACEKSKADFDFLNHAKSQKIIGTPFYMSPLLKKLYSLATLGGNKNKNNINGHNPFKSDIYSLGIVFLEVSLAGTEKKIPKKLEDFIKNINEENLDFFENSDNIFDNKYIYEIDNDSLNHYSPNKSLFEFMLHEDESKRLDILRLSLLYDLPLFMWPFSTQFNSCTLTTKSLSKNQQINYLNGFTYIGSFVNEKRSGSSCRIKNNQNQDYFVGEFYDDFPNGEGVINLNENYKYIGGVSYGKLHGMGKIYCGNEEQKHFGNKWMNNKMMNYLKGQEKAFKFGCLYKYNFLKGYQEKYTGKYLQIMIPSDNVGPIFSKLYNSVKKEALENVNKLFFFIYFFFRIYFSKLKLQMQKKRKN